MVEIILSGTRKSLPVHRIAAHRKALNRCLSPALVLPIMHRRDVLPSATGRPSTTMTPAIKSIQDVAERQLCSGCGACAYIQPDAVTMVDDLDQGRRPLVAGGAETAEALAACPGAELVHEYDKSEVLSELHRGWGPVREIWEGWASDHEVRLEASSGGAATALALFGIEHDGAGGVLHIAAREDIPTLNETRLSRTRADVTAATGSRYAPASPCDSLHLAESADAPVIFIGKPCDAAAVKKARALRPALDEKISVTIAIFCAGAPSTRGTHEMLKVMGFDHPLAVDSVNYRGKGWPGRARGVQAGREESLSYHDSWGKVLQRFVPWRCRICPDHTGEFADISVGDPWYHGTIPEGEAGRSLVLARTQKGVEFLRRAREAGVLNLEPRGAEALTLSQPNLLHVRGAVFGRVLTSRLLGAAVPRYRGFYLFDTWLKHLSLKQRAQAFYGTVKRVFTKNLRGRQAVVPFEPTPQPRETRPAAQGGSDVA
ncbi:MAG: coenzyme F420 hydrogenase subunit beta [Paracoccaceae bacterium]|jgi:coenzyme F420 hydrogenase subunit beta